MIPSPRKWVTNCLSIWMWVLIIRPIVPLLTTISFKAVPCSSRPSWWEIFARKRRRLSRRYCWAKTFSSEPDKFSTVTSVRNPRPPIFTPRIGVQRGSTKRAALSMVPSPPRTMTSSACAARAWSPCELFSWRSAAAEEPSMIFLFRAWSQCTNCLSTVSNSGN